MSARESSPRRVSLSRVALATPDGVRLGWGSGHHAVELVPGDPGLAHVAFEVLDAGGHEAVAERARAMGAVRCRRGGRPDGAALQSPEERGQHPPTA
jgi:catechol 2,3-dioxygenase-like lactoylglutathione lyase family enzyme